VAAVGISWERAWGIYCRILTASGEVLKWGPGLGPGQGTLSNEKAGLTEPSARADDSEKDQPEK
jgi:hypothetical protein